MWDTKIKSEIRYLDQYVVQMQDNLRLLFYSKVVKIPKRFLLVCLFGWFFPSVRVDITEETRKKANGAPVSVSGQKLCIILHPG